VTEAQAEFSRLQAAAIAKENARIANARCDVCKERLETVELSRGRLSLQQHNCAGPSGPDHAYSNPEFYKHKDAVTGAIAKAVAEAMAAERAKEEARRAAEEKAKLTVRQRIERDMAEMTES
jgi:hypothetical protein